MVAKQGGQLKKTAKHSAIYAIGTMFRRLTGLVMLPIYTRSLTPADYGVVELLSMAIEIAGILIGLRISQAMFRYYILAETDNEKDKILQVINDVNDALDKCGNEGKFNTFDKRYEAVTQNKQQKVTK